GLGHQRVRPSRPPLRQGGPRADRRRRAALRRPRGQPPAVGRRPVRPARRRAPGARRPRPGRAGPGPGGAPADRPPAYPAAVRCGPVPGARRRQRGPRAGVHRAARPHRRHRPPAAGRLALPRGRAVLRGDPRQPDGPGEPPPLPLDPRPDHRLLGRGVQRRRVRGARRARRPVRVPRRPRRGPLGPDAGRARHHPGRPGRDHPGRVPRRPRRRRRSGHGQDRRRPAPLGLPPVLRPAARVAPGRRAVRRPEPALPVVRGRRPAQPRGGRRADLHAAGPRPGGTGGGGRDRPGGGPPEGVRGPGAGDRGGRPVLRGAAGHGNGGRHPVVRAVAERRGLGRGVPGGRTRHPAQRGPRPGPGGAAVDPGRQVRRRRLGRPAPQVAAAERGAAGGARPGVAAARRGRPRRGPVVGARLPAQVRARAGSGRAAGAAARGRPGLDGVRPAAAGRGPAPARRPGGGPAPAPPGRRRGRGARADGRGHRQPHRGRRLRAAADDQPAPAGPAGCPGRRGRAARGGPGPARRPVRARGGGRGPGADRRGVADAAAALPVPQRHHRRGPGPGPARVPGVVGGPAPADRARPGHRGLPEHQLPDTGGGHGRGRAGHPGRAPGRQRADLDPGHRHPGPPRVGRGARRGPGQLAGRARRRHRLRHRRSRVPAGDPPGPVADPGAVEGAGVRPGRPGRPGGVRRGRRRGGGPLRRDDPGDPAARRPHQPL
ncbi:MAG: Superfamily I DNA and RNA helicases, partial [uncultured Corynebacteriales bacterium]